MEGKENEDDAVENPVKKEEVGLDNGEEEHKSISSSDTHVDRNYESKFLTANEWDDEKLNLHEDLIRGLKDEGYNNPSKIQAFAIPAILGEERKNMIAQS